MYKLFSALMIHRPDSIRRRAGRIRGSSTTQRMYGSFTCEEAHPRDDDGSEVVPLRLGPVKRPQHLKRPTSADSHVSQLERPFPLKSHKIRSLKKIVTSRKSALPNSQTPFFTTKMPRPFCFFEPKFLQAFCRGSRRCGVYVLSRLMLQLSEFALLSPHCT